MTTWKKRDYFSRGEKGCNRGFVNGIVEIFKI